MLNMLFAGIVAASGLAYTPAQLAEYKAQVRASCEISLKAPGTDVPKGFCACFANAASTEAMGLTPRQKIVLLLLTENAGDPIGAQKLARDRHSMTVEEFAAAWETLNPIGQKAGTACSKKK